MPPAKSGRVARASSPLSRLVDSCRKGAIAPVYVLVGENPEIRPAAEAMIDVLVPPERRSFNLEVYDGRTTPMARVLDSLRTPAFFPGIKVVWVRDSAVFLTSAKKGEIAKSMWAAWEGGRQRDAAEKLATLVGLAGWSVEQFVDVDWSSLKKTALRDVFGDEIGPEHVTSLQAIHQACQGFGIDLADFREEAATLSDFLDRELPADSILLFTVAAVDARKRITKRVQEIGQVVEFTIERERSGALGRDSVLALARERAAAHAKQLEPGALDVIARRAGPNVGVLTNEIDKLCLYVGERPRITDADARAVLLDMAESWIFDFTGALAARDVERALPIVRALLSQGEPPLRILAVLAREVRLLLIAREAIEHLAPGTWRRGTTYATFQSRVLPALDPETQAAFGKTHPFALFRRFEDAARISVRSLRAGLVDLAALDARFKSSAGDPALLMERFVVSFCR